MVEVMHPNSKVAIYPLERLTRLHDIVRQMQEEWWADDESDIHAGGEGEAEETWSMDQDGVWQPQSRDAPDADEWEETDESDGDMNIDAEDLADETFMMSPSEPQDFPHDVPSNVSLYLEPPQDHVEVDVITHDHTATPPLSAEHSKEICIENDKKEGSLSPHWKRFDMLPSVPQDHAFISTTPGQPSKSFLARLTREYRVLETSLPGWLCFALSDLLSALMAVR
jgi:ubiquitin-conjugating enzyme E2 O